MQIQSKRVGDKVEIRIGRRRGKGKIIYGEPFVLPARPTKEEKDAAIDFLVSEGASDKFRRTTQIQGEV